MHTHSGHMVPALPFHQSLIPVNLTEPQQMKMDRLLRSERRVDLDCRRESEYGRRRKRWRLELACACEEETRRDSADRVAAAPSMLLFNALALALNAVYQCTSTSTSTGADQLDGTKSRFKT